MYYGYNQRTSRAGYLSFMALPLPSIVRTILWDADLKMAF